VGSGSRAPGDIDLERLVFRSVVMDTMAEGLYTVDGAGMLTSLNRAGTEMLGWAENELLGTSIHDAVHSPRGEVGALEKGCSLLEMVGRSAEMVNKTFVRKDGSTFQVTCTVATLETGAVTPGTVVTFRDVTEMQRAELESRHDQKLESLGRLSAGLAHEINTPIQYVGDNTRFLASAYADMLELLLVYRDCMALSLGELGWAERTVRAQQAETKADVEYLAAEIPTAVSQSLEGIERVAALVRAMKSFSYKDTAEQSYADLNEAIRTTLTVASNEVKYVADVVLDLAELPEVMCQRGDLSQVFLNLLVNAADALADKPERGEIRISSAVAGPTVVISFVDNGSGIPEHIRQSIFDPFFTTKGVGKGTGQGLALARAVLDKHGGSIDVRSVMGEGTEFTLRLPIAGRPDTSV
jgi:PAS domain S-box-containing protein